MKFSLVFTSCLAVATAAPTWSPDVANWYTSVGQHIKDLKQNNKIGQPPSCDTSKMQWSKVMMKEDATLPKPNGTMTVIVGGRGVQNYTCNPSTPDAAPKAIGAIANLYDLSCYGNTPDLLHQWPRNAIDMPTPEGNSPLNMFAEFTKVGHHYFSASGSPVFDLNDNGNKGGVVVVAKKADMPAPAGSKVGQYDSGNGAVPWLYLASVAGSASNTNAVYRIETAGGKAPASCQGQPATFSVQYATLYFGWKEPTN